jgi:EmrB/QacA subfamily drug resistance transporter
MTRTVRINRVGCGPPSWHSKAARNSSSQIAWRRLGHRTKLDDKATGLPRHACNERRGTVSAEATLDGTRTGGAAPSTKWAILAIVATAQLMIVLDASVVNIALPHAQQALRFSDSSRQWVLTAYTLTFGGLLLLGGRVADFFGRRRMFLVGLIGFAAASAVGGAAQSSAWLFAARAVQGMFAAIMAPAVLSLITTTFVEARDRARAFSAYGAVSGAGWAIGVVLGGALTQFLNWRWTLLINAPIAIVLVLASLPVIPESHEKSWRHFDVLGAVLATAGTATLVYGFTEASVQSWTASSTLGSIAAGIALLAAFVVSQVRSNRPILPMRIVLDRNRGGSYLAFLLGTIAMFGVLLFLTYYFQNVHHYSPFGTGIAFLPFPLGLIVSTAIAARTLPLLGPKALAGIGFTLGAAGLLWLTRLTPATSYWTQIAPAMTLASLGLGQVFVPMSSTALLGVAPSDAGVASALVNTTQQIGGSLGVAFLNTVAITATAHYAIGHSGSSLAAAVHGFTAAFEIAAGVMAVAAIAVTALLQPRAGAVPVRRSSTTDRQFY